LHRGKNDSKVTTFHKIDPGYYIPDHAKSNELSYPTEGNDQCYAMEEHSQWFQARNRNLENIMLRFPFKGDFLDVGGGNGYQLHFLQKGIFRERGILSAMCEPGPKGCANAASRGVENIYCCLFDELPFEKFMIGGIGLFDVIEHIKDDKDFINLIASKVPAGTRLYITVPALKFLWSSEDAYAGHYRRYDAVEEARILSASKLKLVYSCYFFSYYVPFVYLLRVLPEKWGRKYSVEQLKEKEQSYHSSSGKLNRILNFLHTCEMMLAKIGLKPFWGTSRLMVLEVM